MVFRVDVTGLEDLAEFRTLGPRTAQAASRAINTVARKQRTTAARRIGDQIALPRSLLGPNKGRLYISQFSTPSNLVARITARSKPTSLARFVKGARKRGRGVSIEIKPGRLKRIQRAFILKLRSGAQLTETKFNLGLAVRLRPGERIQNKRKFLNSSSNLYLLYGPSVQQVFLSEDGTGVARDLERSTADTLQTEFLRLLRL